MFLCFLFLHLIIENCQLLLLEAGVEVGIILLNFMHIQKKRVLARRNQKQNIALVKFLLATVFFIQCVG